MQDLRYAVRMLVNKPGFTAVAVATLALGIGANTAIFSVVHGVLLRPLPFPEPDRLVLVWETDRHNDTRREAASVPDYFDWREQAQAFEELAGFQSRAFNLTDGVHEPERVTVGAVTHTLFPLLRVPAAAGRTFLPEEDQPGAAPVALLSHGLWQRRFGGDPDVVGSTLSLDARDHTVVGIMPPHFDFPGEAELWIPAVWTTEWSRELRGVHNLLALGRLEAGIPLARAQEEMDAVAARLEAEYPEDNAHRGVFLEPLHEAVVGDVRPALLVLLGAVALVLLIACVNVANLLLARATSRAREIALRASLGASRLRLVRQLLTESLLLAVVGGGAGLLLAFWGLEALLALTPDLPRTAGIDVEPVVLAFTLGLSLATGLIFGLIPALQATRTDLMDALKAGPEGAWGSGRRRGLRHGLVIGELALAVVLVVGAGLLMRSFWRLLQVAPGFEPRHALTLDVKLPESRYPPPPRADYPRWPEAAAFYDQVLARIAALPGVRAVGAGLNHPLKAGWTTRMTVDDRPTRPGEELDEVRLRPVTPDYFRAAGVPLLAGRFLEPGDGQEAPAVVLINQALARRYFPDENPVGRALSFWGRSRRIVGVVQDVKFDGLGRDTAPAMYPPLAQIPMSEFSLVVRTAGDPLSLAPALTAAIWSVDRDLAVFNLRSLEQVLASSLARPRSNMLLLAIFAAVALLLAAVGVYGVMSYGVSERSREIGIRLALGAGREQVLRWIVGQGLALTAGALGLGLAVALALTQILPRLLSDLLFGVAATDLPTFAATALVLAGVALLACYLPARRAARLDPLATLRYE